MNKTTTTKKFPAIPLISESCKAYFKTSIMKMSDKIKKR